MKLSFPDCGEMRKLPNVALCNKFNGSHGDQTFPAPEVRLKSQITIGHGAACHHAWLTKILHGFILLEVLRSWVPV